MLDATDTTAARGDAALEATPRRVRDALHHHWRSAAGYQHFAYGAAALMVLSGLFHAGALLVSGDSLAGDVSFRKPATFGLSFGLTLATLASFLTVMARNRILGWITMTGLALASLYEVFAVTLQRWRGVPSHFNNATPFDAAVFSLMGIAVALIGLIIVVVTLWSFLPMLAPPGLALALRLGLLLLIAGQVFGLQIIANGDALIDAGSAGPYNIFGEAGVMKLPHFFAMHAVQVLPALALLLGLGGAAGRRAPALVGLAAAGYTSLLAVTAVQMYSGLPPLALGTASALLFAAGLIALGISGWAALRPLIGRRTVPA